MMKKARGKFSTVLLLMALACLSAQPSLVAAASTNWLIGGTWVARNVPCPPEEMDKSITPKGMVFSNAALIIHAPPVRPAEAAAFFHVRYDIDGGRIVVHMSQPQNSTRLDMSFDEVSEGLIRDPNGYLYRRCGGGEGSASS